jgi:hypothetical protein
VVLLPEAVLPATASREGDGQALYKQWHEAGRWLWTTPGDFIDHRRVERHAPAEAALNVRRSPATSSPASRPWRRSSTRISTTAPSLRGDPAKNAPRMQRPGQGSGGAGEGRARSQLRHDGNPVMTWMVGNAVVDRRVDGSILPKKEKPNSPNKIDGIDALVNAMRRCSRSNTRAPPMPGGRW